MAKICPKLIKTRYLDIIRRCGSAEALSPKSSQSKTLQKNTELLTIVTTICLLFTGDNQAYPTWNF